MLESLPIDEALPRLLDALRTRGSAVLQAPPGAGKSTRVPLALLSAEITADRIVMLEPRRLAARATAQRMAETLGEPLGRTVGYRIRGETKTSAATRIEVVTEGILTRMLQSDPSLPGIGALIFDEFHERSVNADLGLALAWEVRGALRPELILLVMSATLDADPVAGMLGGAPLVTSEGRSWPVETRWLDRPLPQDLRWEVAMADLIAQAAAETEGGVLAFLPGQGEISRIEGRLRGRLDEDCHIRPLYGAMDFADQRAAVAPAPEGRKIVLATAIAETSLTIEDVRVVVDSGRARRSRFDPGSGMARLVTERVTRAEADQRRGRAGRVAPGRCYRLWTRGEEGGLAAFPPPEIATSDLAGLALDLALWGADGVESLAFLDAPNPGAWAEARALLADLGALDSAGRISEHGKALVAFPLHPRLAHMLTVAGAGAADLAALLSDRDPLIGAPADLTPRVAAVRNPSGYARAYPWTLRRGTVERLRAEARRLAASAPADMGLSLAEQAALAYPDRIGMRRRGDDARWLLSGGRGATMDPSDPLAGAPLLVATETDGNPREARIRQAISISECTLRGLFPERLNWVESCVWSRREGRVLARREERLGALVLTSRPWTDAPADAMVQAMLDGVREIGLSWSPSAKRLRARSELVRTSGANIADLSDAGLMERLEDWLAPFLGGITTAAAFRALDLTDALRAYLGWDALERLDRFAPAHFTTPLGRAIPIDYAGGTPAIEVRLQEMFGLTDHPMAAGQPIRVSLLSPAGRPVQTTQDLPGFWATSYADVRKDMRGRYPKHPWPEDPTRAEPTLRAKPRS